MSKRQKHSHIEKHAFGGLILQRSRASTKINEKMSNEKRKNIYRYGKRKKMRIKFKFVLSILRNGELHFPLTSFQAPYHVCKILLNANLSTLLVSSFITRKYKRRLH